VRATAQARQDGYADGRYAKNDCHSENLVTGDENALHRHPNEDHVFVVLQGEAEFYGPKNETRRVGKGEGMMMSSTAYYWFRAVSDEPLVMLRIGAATLPDADDLERIDELGNPDDGYAERNKEVPLILYENKFYE